MSAENIVDGLMVRCEVDGQHILPDDLPLLHIAIDGALHTWRDKHTPICTINSLCTLQPAALWSQPFEDLNLESKKCSLHFCMLKHVLRQKNCSTFVRSLFTMDLDLMQSLWFRFFVRIMSMCFAMFFN